MYQRSKYACARHEKRNESIARISIYYIIGYPSLLLLLGHFYSLESLRFPVFGVINAIAAMYFIWKSDIKRQWDLMLFALFEITAFVAGMLYPGNFDYIISYITNTSFLLEAIPAMFIFRISKDYKKMIRWGAEVGVFALTINTVIRFLDVTTINYMTYANLSVIPWCFVVLYARMEKKLIYRVLACVYGALLILFSSRGGILYVSAYIIYTVLLSSIRPKGKLALLVALAIIVGYVIVDFENVIAWVNRISTEFGVYNRVLDNINRNVLFTDNARTHLWTSAWKYIWERPLLGYGVCGDCVLFGGTGWYVHNMFLELMLNYGVIIGGALLLAYLFMGVYMIVRCKNVFQKEIFLLFFVVSVSQTMISYSLYLNMAVYVTISLFLDYARNERSYRLKSRSEA